MELNSYIAILDVPKHKKPPCSSGAIAIFFNLIAIDVHCSWELKKKSNFLFQLGITYFFFHSFITPCLSPSFILISSSEAQVSQAHSIYCHRPDHRQRRRIVAARPIDTFCFCFLFFPAVGCGLVVVVVVWVDRRRWVASFVNINGYIT